MHVAAMRTKRLSWAVVLSVFAWLVPAAVFAATATIVPVMDTTIYQGTDPLTLELFEDNSCGAGTNLFSGMTADMFLRRALVKFPISQAEGGPIPPGSVINSVTVTVDVPFATARISGTYTCPIEE